VRGPFSRDSSLSTTAVASRCCEVSWPRFRGQTELSLWIHLRRSNCSFWKRCSPLCHAACPGVLWERSRGICSSADLSWKCFWNALSSQLSSRNCNSHVCDLQ
jgi:hypothetical protein